MLLAVPGDYFAPGALGSAYEELAKSSNFRKTTQSMAEYLVKFDLLRWQAEEHTLPGGTISQTFVAALLLQQAIPCRREGSLVFASMRGHSRIRKIAQQIGCAFGPTGCV